MSYLDDHLMASEAVKYRARLHPIVFVRPVLLTVLGVASMVSTAIGGIGILLVLVGLLDFAGGMLLISTSEFGVTNRRVLIKVGVIRRHSLETLLAKIEGIGVDQGLFGRLFGYGTITVTGTGGTKEQFARIRDPLAFRRAVQEQIG